ncbi:NAD(P)/FAD-dependent oxidoreductase [Nitrosomonas communis]|uniref:Thioredoxin reductase n=1 Tax=Nitrosomonas communis TaxID=44574 RepID=A0A1I4S3H0_9PROT|nr:NAD(P)/FAD-dependent oxidoreductase [Nitrosomonas communis]SFM58999.1 Thioredoxin reductase [Nitrosomonas communis]
MYDVIIVGGGPAGLSAALILGRCLRSVLVCDNGKPRNAFSRALHGYLTRDGIPPFEFIASARKEIQKYETVKFFDAEVSGAKRKEGCFEVTLSSGIIYHSKKLLLATGVVDAIPKIQGIEEHYGKSVHTCPYCDAWEVRGKQLAVFGKGERGFKLSLSLKTWSEDVTLLTDGPSGFLPEQREKLENNGIKLREEKIRQLKGEDGQLKYIEFQSGEVLPREALFFNTESYLRSGLLEELGCPYEHEEGVFSGKYEMTEVPGLYVAGNICRDIQLVIVAAAEGAQAAFGINTALTQENQS